MTAGDITFLEEQNTEWRCDPCGKVRRKSMRLENSAQEGKITLDDIMETLKEIRAEQRKNVSDFNESNNLLHNKVEENTKHFRAELRRLRKL